MPINIIEVVDSVISDAQSLLDELEHDNKARDVLDILLRATHLIQNELTEYVLPDGSVDQLPKEFGSYTRTPFAVFETGVNLIKKLTSSGTIVLSGAQLEQLEQMKTKAALVKEQLDEIWGTR